MLQSVLWDIGCLASFYLVLIFSFLQYGITKQKTSAAITIAVWIVPHNNFSWFGIISMLMYIYDYEYSSIR